MGTATKTRPPARQRAWGERRGVVEETGQPLYHYDGDPDKHLIVTGPIRGSVVLADGTVVDVSPDIIEVDTREQALEISHHIGLRHEDEGHPNHMPSLTDPFPEPFAHLCTPDTCGEHARDITDPMQALAMSRAVKHAMGVADPTHRVEVARAFGIDADAPGLQMALASAAAENAALNGLDGTGSTNVIPDVALHVATPGTTGASETANSGSYARQACSWNAASGGSKTNSTSLTFSTLGTIAVTHIGTWSSATYAAGNYAIGAALGSSVTSASITIASGAISFSAS